MELVKMVRECGQRHGLFTCNFHVSFSRFHWPSPVTHSVLLQWFSPFKSASGWDAVSTICIPFLVFACVFVQRSFEFEFLSLPYLRVFISLCKILFSITHAVGAALLSVRHQFWLFLSSHHSVFFASGLCVWNLLWPMAAMRRSKLQCDCNQAGPYEAFRE